MTYVDAIQFLYRLRWFGAKFGLANTLKLAALAGNPHERLRFIHIAGTNGKGSTAAMLESIYRAAGLRVGLFTSPHLVSFRERIQINRRLIPESKVVDLVGEIQKLIEVWWRQSAREAAQEANRPSRSQDPADHPTFFEVVTVMALKYFAAERCDLVVWETGLGGRLDATSIVTPLAAIITNIQFDHQEYLGETLASIAAEKAGIIKPGVPLITGTDAPEALAVLETTARKQNAPLTLVPPRAGLRPPLDALELPLPGRHQKMNAAVALAAVRVLQAQIPVSDEALRTGLARVHWPGRLQLVCQPGGRRVLLDGAHNVGGAETLAAALRENFSGSKPALILGVLRDKDWPHMCGVLAPLAKRVLPVPVQSERSAEPHALAEACRAANRQAEILECSSIREALERTAENDFVVIAGSLYLIGEAMEVLKISAGNGFGERGLNEWGTPGSKSETRNPKSEENRNIL